MWYDSNVSEAHAASIFTLTLKEAWAYSKMFVWYLQYMTSHCHIPENRELKLLQCT
jgi:hypothetical protein